MRIYYDELAKNIVLGQANRLFATGSLEASEFRGRVSIVYKDTNFRELFLAHDRILKQDGTRAGLTLQAVLNYLNTEFNKSPFDGVVAGGVSTQIYLLSSINILEKQIFLEASPIYPDRTLINMQEGIAQYANVDFQIIGNVVKWEGLSMEFLVEEGQRLHVTYQ